MSRNSMMIRAFVGVLLITSLILSLSTCTADDACYNYEDLCPDIDEGLCAEVLKGQSNKVINCIYYADSCVKIHKCLDVDSDLDSDLDSATD